MSNLRIDQVSDGPALLDEALRNSFVAFLYKAFATINGGNLLDWNWHLDAIIHQLDGVANGRGNRLLVTMPPRNLKSITISVAWVAWRLGHNPSLNFVCVSYSSELADKLARDCLAIMQSDWYRRIFPDTMISSKRAAAHDFDTTAGGGRLATSVTGTLTGRGGDIIIIDDPVKPDDANSETVRESVNDWYRTTLTSRLNDKRTGAIICVMQRLHAFDLAGQMLEDGGWQHLSLPAIAIDDEHIPLTRGRTRKRFAGEPLHPKREPLSVLEQIRQDQGSAVFNAQYQQNPVPADGNVIKADWLGTYLPNFDRHSPGQIVQSWDTASKDGVANDWSVCVTAHVYRGLVRILDVYRARLTMPELKRQCVRLAAEHRADVVLIEDAASGTQLLQLLRAETLAGFPRPIAIRPEQDKLTRLHGISPMIEAGQMLLPQDAAWLADFKSELLGFPNSRYADQVDALSQLLGWVRRSHVAGSYVVGAPILIEAEALDHSSADLIDDWDGEDEFGYDDWP